MNFLLIIPKLSFSSSKKMARGSVVKGLSTEKAIPIPSLTITIFSAAEKRFSLPKKRFK